MWNADSEDIAFPVVFRDGGGIVFVSRKDKSVAVLRIHGGESLEQPLECIGILNVEHLVFVSREIERELGIHLTF